MKFLLKLFFGLFALVLLAIALVFGCVYMIEKVVPDIAAQRLKAMTGYRLDIGSVELSILGGSASVKDVTLRNPEEWPEEGFLKINQATFDVAPTTLIGDGRKVIDELVLDIGPVVIVTNKDKKVNAKVLLEKLQSAQKEAEEAPTAGEEVKKEAKPIEFLVRRLVIRAESLRIADYSGPTPKIREQRINLNVELHNVSDVKEVLPQLMAQGGSQLLLMLSNVQLNLGGDSEDDDNKGAAGSIVDPVKKGVQGAFDALKDKIKSK